MHPTTKRSFLTIAAGSTYAVPEYASSQLDGRIETTSGTIQIRLVRDRDFAESKCVNTVPGTLHENLLTVLIEDLKSKNSLAPSKEVAMAITNMEQARHWLEERDRQALLPL